MHEMSLAESIVEIVEDTAMNGNSGKVRAVWIEVGQLAAVEKEALRFCFDAATRGGVAEGARLEIIDTPGSGWCMKCAAPVALAALYDPCPACGSYQIQVTGGNEMRVKELEVE